MDINEVMEYVKFVNDGWAITLPLILIVLDIVTGVVNGIIKGEMDSSVMRQGLGHKFSEIIYLALGILADIFFKWHGVYLLMIIYISFMEIVSILENCSKLGVPMPEFLKNILKIKE